MSAGCAVRTKINMQAVDLSVRMAHPADMAIPECHEFATHQSFLTKLSVFVLITGFSVIHKDMACAEYVTTYR